MDMGGSSKSRGRSCRAFIQLIENYKAKLAIALIVSAALGVGISIGKLYLFHLFAILFVSVSVFSILHKRSWLFNRDLYVLVSPLYFILLWYLSSLFWVEDVKDGIRYIFYILNGLIIIHAIIAVARNHHNLTIVYKLVGVVIILEIIISILEGTTSFRYPISPYSDYVQFFNRARAYDSSLPQHVIASIMNIPTGFHWNPNNLALTMLIVIPFFLFYSNNWIKVVGGGSAFVVILLTGSRGVLIALAAMLVFAYVFYFSKKSKLIIFLTVLLAFGCLAIFKNSLIENYSHRYRELSTTAQAFQNYVYNTNEIVNDSSSITIRRRLIENGMEAFNASHGVGVGAGNSLGIQARKANTYGVQSMHNFWVEILVEGGMLVFLVWSIWYLYLTFKVYKVYKNSKTSLQRYLARSCGLSLFGLMIGMVAVSTPIYFFPMWMLLGFSIGVVYYGKMSHDIIIKVNK